METTEKSNPAASLVLVAVFVALSALLIAVAWNQLGGGGSNDGRSTVGQPNTPTIAGSVMTPGTTPTVAATEPTATATATATEPTATATATATEPTATATAAATVSVETPAVPTATSESAGTTAVATGTATEEPVETVEPTTTTTTTPEPTPPSQPEATATTWPPSLPTTHVVRTAETLNSIAQLYGISFDLLRGANPAVNPASPTIGSDLLIPSPDGSMPSSSAYERLHVVQPGETVMQIAEMYGLTVDVIAQANNLTNPNVLSEGTILLIPRAK